MIPSCLKQDFPKQKLTVLQIPLLLQVIETDNTFSKCFVLCVVQKHRKCSFLWFQKQTHISCSNLIKQVCLLLWVCISDLVIFCFILKSHLIYSLCLFQCELSVYFCPSTYVYFLRSIFQSIILVYPTDHQNINSRMPNCPCS